jgi:hypothetical protein
MYLKTFNNFKSDIINESESILTRKLEQWDNDIKDVMFKFTDKFTDLIKDIDKWADTKDPDKIRNDFTETLSNAFLTLNESIKNIKKESTLDRLYDDIPMIIIHIKDIFNKELLVESAESIQTGLRYVINSILDSVIEYFQEKVDYIDEIEKGKDLEDKKDISLKYFIKMFDKIKTSIKNINIDILMENGEKSINNIKDKNNNLAFDQGDIIQYMKSDNTEAIAQISKDQELDDDSLIRVITKSNNAIILRKSQIIKKVEDEEEK